MAIDRQGLLIANPDGAEKLYSGDKLLLLGARDPLIDAEQLLRGSGTPRGSLTGEFDQIAMETVTIPQLPASATLEDLNLAVRYGIQICGIERAGQRTLIPSFSQQILTGDRLLLLGTHDRIQRWRSELVETSHEADPLILSPS
jgi:Trk K+ transport system NAD-binding subunit